MMKICLWRRPQCIESGMTSSDHFQGTYCISRTWTTYLQEGGICAVLEAGVRLSAVSTTDTEFGFQVLMI